MSIRNVVRRLGGALVVCGLFLVTAGGASAQTNTGTIRGTITGADDKPLSGAEIVARNVASGVQRLTSSRSDGGYNLPGLVPATYELTVRRIGTGAQSRLVVVQVGATQVIDFRLDEKAIEVQEITATAAALPETRTSEVATNITREQIEKLPTPSRNFLDLAVLAPGVSVSEDRINGTSRNITAGGQSSNSVNIFVDGASLKNDLTAGGIAGQDASRGNPFPRNAVQEYRVISQNFKAEYQKASSAIITATTKSGGNIWSGNAFFGYQDKSLVARDTFDIANHVKKSDYSRSLIGFSAGGPLIKNKLHFFGSYEGNYQNRTNTVNFTPPTGIAALDTVALTGYNGSKQSPFRESLFFGKLSYAVSSKSSAEFSFSNRHETDVRDFGGTRSLQSAVNFRNNVSIGTLKYNYFNGPWLNEANVTYERFRRNPSPDTPGLPARLFHYPGQDAQIGSNLSTQDFTQKRLGFRNDLTYSGFQAGGQHVFKLGGNLDFVKYDVIKRNGETPQFEYAQYVDSNSYGWTTDPLQKAFNFQTPYQLTYGTGVPGLNVNNTQLGLYLQDDWTPTPRLTVNLGLRWDYESNMFNTKYKTPQNVVDTLTRYNDSLPSPLDLNRYISTGSNRKPYKGAFQPRVGFSYALDKDNKTTVFGGFGIFYDRS
ncbi:MAG: TonB-dependent receptor, partial [Gemmatimonadota bacterium]